MGDADLLRRGRRSPVAVQQFSERLWPRLFASRDGRATWVWPRCSGRLRLRPPPFRPTRELRSAPRAAPSSAALQPGS